MTEDKADRFLGTQLDKVLRWMFCRDDDVSASCPACAIIMDFDGHRLTCPRCSLVRVANGD